MVNKKAPTYGRAGVDVNGSQPASKIGEEACQPLEPLVPQPMVNAVGNDRVYAGISGNDFESVT